MVTATTRTVAVNDVVIGHAAIAREVQNQDAASPRAAWECATRALVVRELLAQRARVLGIAAQPRSAGGVRETEEEATIRALIEAEVRTPTADEAACRRYYDSNPASFRSPDLFEPAHILFKAARADKAAYDIAIGRATSVLDELKLAPERFEGFASALSACPSARDGGRLGQVVCGETTPEFEAAMLRLEPGQLCAEPVCTRYGVHVLRLDRKAAGVPLPFAQVRDRIATYLEESVWRRGVAQYVALLAGDARIAGYDMHGATSPLVQ